MAPYDAEGNYLQSYAIIGSFLNDEYNYVVSSEQISYIAISTLLAYSNPIVSIFRNTDLNYLKNIEIPFLNNSTFITTTGRPETNSSYETTDFIFIKGVKEFKVISATMGNPYGGGIIFYDKNKQFISSIYNVTNNENDDYTLDLALIPNNAYFIKVQGRTAYYPRVYCINPIVSIISEISDIIYSIDDKIKILENNFEIPFLNNSTFINSSGAEETFSVYETTDFLLIKGLEELKVFNAVMGNSFGGGIIFYDKFKQFISSIYNVTEEEQGDYILDLSLIPNNAYFIKIQGRTDYNTKVEYKNPIINKDNEILDIIYSGTSPWKREKSLYSVSSNSLSANEQLNISDSPHIRSGYCISVFSQITTMGRISLSKGLNNYMGGRIEIDSENIYEYNSNNMSNYNTYAHGLTISSFLKLDIICYQNPMTAITIGEVLLRLQSDSGIYEKKIMWNGGGEVILQSISAVLTDVSVTLSIKNKNIWFFGDSYLDFILPNLYLLKASNFLADGHTGRDSYRAWVSLNNELKCNIPKQIIWAMGMNNGDSSDAVNVDWYYYYQQLIKLCNKYNIEPIFVTIPNTPIINNSYKNSIIRNGNVKYFDVAKIVGSDISVNWFNGLLSGDNVHPSELGAKYIADYYISQCAEILD